VIGCDIDPKMTADARAEAAEQGAAIRYTMADAEHLPFRDESFDIVTIVTVLAFVARPDRAVREIARVLKPGGELVYRRSGQVEPVGGLPSRSGLAGSCPDVAIGAVQSGRRTLRARERGQASGRACVRRDLLSSVAPHRALHGACGLTAWRADRLRCRVPGRAGDQNMSGKVLS